jgi:hypothetical protein
MTYTDRYGEITIDDIKRIYFSGVSPEMQKNLKDNIIKKLPEIPGWVIMTRLLEENHRLIIFNNTGMIYNFDLCYSSGDIYFKNSKVIHKGVLSDFKIYLLKNTLTNDRHCNADTRDTDKYINFVESNYRNLLFQDDMMNEIKALQDKNTEMIQENEDLKRRLSRLEKFIDGLI